MSAARPLRPLRCLFNASPSKSPRPVSSCSRCRPFHTSPNLCANRRPKHQNIKAEDMGLIRPAKEVLKPFTAEEKEKLAKKYTPQQMAAIEAGEATIDPEDIVNSSFRVDQNRITYLDDFATIRTIIDKPARAPEENYDPNLRFKTEDEIAADLTEWLKNSPDDVSRLDYLKWLDQYRLTVGKEEAERNPVSYLAPKLPRIDDPDIKYTKVGQEEIDPAILRLSQMSGLSVGEISRIKTKIVVKNFVANQTRMGKIRSFFSMAVAGDGNGMLGIGEGKSTDAGESMRQATAKAIRNMVPIPRYENRTIYGEVEGKVGAVELKLSARPPGFGVRCQERIFEMCRVAGIDDLSARVTRSRNPMNTVKAAFQALLSQRIPDEVARARGKKLVDVRKVYYGGRV